MPPEQAAGKPVDKRSDVWAFGVVLFEMLSGQRLFSGETVAPSGRGAHTEPEWDALPTETTRPGPQAPQAMSDEGTSEAGPRHRDGTVRD